MWFSPRKRPLIYIYDLPAEFNSRMHQYRLNKVWLSALADNWTVKGSLLGQFPKCSLPSHT